MITKASPASSYAYYPGCSLMATNRAYDVSTRRVARQLGVEMVELDDWNCCGATAYLPIREKRAFVLSARNLAIAEQNGRELATVCNACYVVLRKTNKYMAEDAQLRDDIRRALQAGGLDYSGAVRVRHFLEIVVNDVGEERVKSRQLMERLVAWLGAAVVPFPLAAKCCGGMAMTTHPETGRVLTGKILKVAKQRGAGCVATACPLCQINLEAYQDQAGRAVGAACDLPVLYFTQLMGIAFGLPPVELALQDNLTSLDPLLAEKVGS